MPALYENWPVYQKTLRVRLIATELRKDPPPRVASDLDVLRDSAASTLKHIALGAAKVTKTAKLRAYERSLGRANRCNAAIAVLLIEMNNDPLLVEAKSLMDEVLPMLLALLKSIEKRSA